MESIYFFIYYLRRYNLDPMPFNLGSEIGLDKIDLFIGYPFILFAALERLFLLCSR